MANQSPPSEWLLIVVTLLLLERVRKKQTGLELLLGANKLRAVISFYPKDEVFMLKGEYMLAIGKDKMARCVLALR